MLIYAWRALVFGTIVRVGFSPIAVGIRLFPQPFRLLLPISHRRRGRKHGEWNRGIDLRARPRAPVAAYRSGESRDASLHTCLFRKPVPDGFIRPNAGRVARAITLFGGGGTALRRCGGK